MHKQNFIARLVNQWFDRVMGALSEGSLSDQKEEYAAHRTTRDFIWNTVGVGAWSPLRLAASIRSWSVQTKQACSRWPSLPARCS